jgi:hypothetical protein
VYVLKRLSKKPSELQVVRRYTYEVVGNSFVTRSALFFRVSSGHIDSCRAKYLSPELKTCGLFDRILTRKEGNHHARYRIDIAQLGLVDTAPLGLVDTAQL